jgi:hypothetical protein
MTELEIVLRKMCEYVGADYDSIDFKKDRWFMDYAWTEDTENEFKNWFINYLKTNKKAKLQLMKYPRITKVDNFVNNFIFNYGWRTKKNENEQNIDDPADISN